jgi:hypothetical protein
VKKYPTLGELPVDPKTPYFNWLVPLAPMLRKETFDHVGSDIETYGKFQFELIAGVKRGEYVQKLRGPLLQSKVAHLE